MKHAAKELLILSALACVWVISAGCESTDGGGGSSNVNASGYYGVGFYDPWYYGDSSEIIVRPPPGDYVGGPRPEHPIAEPPRGSGGSGGMNRPMPSMPSAPRVSGGRR